MSRIKKTGIILCTLALPFMMACTNFLPKPVSSEPVSPDTSVEVIPVDVVPVDSELPSTPPVSLDDLPGYEPTLFDVTGDGVEDQVYCHMTGSGMVRVQCIVEDTAEDKKYVLDGYDYSYQIKGVEDGRLVVVEKGPYGYSDVIFETVGTIRIKNDRLIFVADTDTMKKGLIVKEKQWAAGSTGLEDITTVTVLHGGEEVYSGYSSVIKIGSANNKEVVLEIEGCLVEPNEDGTINMRKEPLKEITIQRDQTIKLVSQTMDAGVKLEIKYE